MILKYILYGSIWGRRIQKGGLPKCAPDSKSLATKEYLRKEFGIIQEFKFIFQEKELNRIRLRSHLKPSL
jgi:hypothetical protein